MKKNDFGSEIDQIALLSFISYLFYALARSLGNLEQVILECVSRILALIFLAFALSHMAKALKILNNFVKHTQAFNKLIAKKLISLLETPEKIEEFKKELEEIDPALSSFAENK